MIGILKKGNPILLLCLILLPAVARTGEPPRMARAVLVYNLSKFVVWPENTFSDPDEPCAFCLLGENDIEPDLALLNGRILNHRKVIFRRIRELSPASKCHVLVIGVVAQTDLKAILEKLEGLPIFTVSDIPRFAGMGGMIEIVSSGARVFFHINLDAAKRAGLSIKAPLLQIATVIHETVP